MPKKQPEENVFVVQRLNWVRSQDEDQEVFLRLPGRTRLQSFPDAASAEQLCRELEEKVRARVNPFRCGNRGLSDKSSLDSDRLHDWLLDAGLEPPQPPGENRPRDWAGWWRDTPLTPEQRGLVWKALDRLRFFEVVERPKRPVVYVVVEVGWHYTDQDFVAEPEGGKPTQVFRKRDDAEAECECANDIARDVWEEALTDSNETLDMVQRVQRQQEPFGEPAPIDRDHWGEVGPDRITEAPFYEVVEVELGTMSDKLWVVQQMGWRTGDRHCYNCEEDHGLPVAVFASKKKAQVHCRALEEQARRELSPVQFFEEAEAVTDLDEETLFLKIQALGLPAPTQREEPASWNPSRIYMVTDWEGWWEQVAPDMTDEQRMGIWNLFKDLKFYRVVSANQEGHED